MFRAFLRDSAIYALPALASRGLSLFLIPLYTRVLAPADYGSLDLFTAFASIVALTVALEVSQGVARFYQQEPAEARRKRYASSAFWFSLLNNSVFALVMIAAAPALATIIMGRAGLEVAFLIGIAQIWITSVFYMIQGQLRWQLQSVKYAIVSLVMVFASTAISAWLTIVGGWGLSGLMLGTVVGTTVGSALGLWWLRETLVFRFDLKPLGEMLSFSIPLVIASVAIWANLYTDRLMINHFLSLQEVGLYGMAYRIASISSLVMVAFQGALTPLIFAHYHKPDTPNEMARIFRLFAMIALAFCLTLSVFSADILRLMTTPEFVAAAPIITFLVPAVLLSNMYVFAPGISIARKTHLSIWISVCGAILNLLFNLAAIPNFGVMGAAGVTLVISAVNFGAYVTLGQLYYRIPYDWRKLSIATCLVVLLVALCSALPPIGVAHWLIGLSALAIYAIGAVGIGLIRLDEVRTVFQAAHSALIRGGR